MRGLWPWPSCFILENLCLTQSVPTNTSSTYWAFPSMCSILTFIWFNPDHPLYTSSHAIAHTYTHTHTHKDWTKLLWSPVSYFTRPLVRSSGATIVTVLHPVLFPKCVQTIIQQYKPPIQASALVVRVVMRVLSNSIQERLSRVCTAWKWASTGADLCPPQAVHVLPPYGVHAALTLLRLLSNLPTLRSYYVWMVACEGKRSSILQIAQISF